MTKQTFFENKHEILLLWCVEEVCLHVWMFCSIRRVLSFLFFFVLKIWKQNLQFCKWTFFSPLIHHSRKAFFWATSLDTKSSCLGSVVISESRCSRSENLGSIPTTTRILWRISNIYQLIMETKTIFVNSGIQFWTYGAFFGKSFPTWKFLLNTELSD